MGSLSRYSILYLPEALKLGFQKHDRKLSFFEMFITFVLMVGWEPVDQNGAPILLNFRFYNKQDV